MQTVILDLAAAVLIGGGCIPGCPVLTGADTPPPGQYTARAMDIMAVHLMDAPGREAYAIHPAWDADRLARLEQAPAQRRNVTAGCINMLPHHFERLPRGRFRLIIK